MGIERQKSPGYFRNRAEEFRAKADQFERRQTKEAMQRAAKNYDELARRAEQVRTVEGPPIQLRRLVKPSS